MPPIYTLNRIFNPAIYQGKHRRRNYFEGWYFKLISADQSHALAVIPGVSLGTGRGDAHAFVQVINGQTCEVDHFRFDISDFRFNEDRFAVSIKGNHFSDAQLTLDLNNGTRRYKGHLEFAHAVKLPRTLLNPGIMGPFSFLPLMECYHGVVNVHHQMCGQLESGSDLLDFTGGYGYIEKDWGRSFPESWLWLQSNHFDTPDVSLMFSVARIPMLHTHFVGFISFLRLGSQFYRFATYTGAKITAFAYEDGVAHISVADRKHQLHIRARKGPAGLLKAPKNGLMTSHVLESITATVDVKLTTHSGQVLFKGTGTKTGMEIVEGIIPLLTRSHHDLS